MRTIAREPLFHFLLLGVLLFAAQVLILPLLQTETIRVSVAEREQLRSQWLRETGRRPTAAEFQALLRRHIDEALLLREAKRLGLHHSDPVVRRRLVNNLRFADPAAAQDDAELLLTAHALGMVERDPVVRGRLIQRMRHRIHSKAAVTEAEARTYYAANRDAFRHPARYRFQQLFFSRKPAAQEALARLRATDPPDPGSLGDPFLLGRRFEGLSLEEAERRFGPAFAQLLEKAPAGAWLGPVTSVYGQHLLRVEAAQPAGTTEYAGVRRRAVSALYAEREQARLQAMLEELRGRYRIDLEAAVSGGPSS